MAEARHGAVYAEGARVARIVTEAGAVAAVELEGGDSIATPRVVNAAGAWAPAVQRTLDVACPPLPLFAMKHAYVPASTSTSRGTRRWAMSR